MSKNIIIDAGNSRFKYDGLKRGQYSSTYCTKYNPNPEYFDRIEYNGKTVYIGTGEYSREYSKVDKECITEQILYGIGLNVGIVDVVNLCLLLPINQMQQKDKYIKTFKEKEFLFKINGTSKQVRIEQCTVIPEGLASYYALDESEAKDEDVTIIDIGYRTTNYAVVRDGKVIKNFTEPIGVFDFFSNVKNIENSNGSNYDEETIERGIRKEIIKPSNNVCLDFFKDILNKTKGSINLKLTKNYFTGGGSEILRKYIEQTSSIVMEDTTYSNVIGAKKLCDKVWR